MFKNIAQNADRRIETCFEMRSRIEAAGFMNVHQQDYKCPIGTSTSTLAVFGRRSPSMRPRRHRMLSWRASSSGGWLNIDDGTVQDRFRLIFRLI